MRTAGVPDPDRRRCAERWPGRDGPPRRPRCRGGCRGGFRGGCGRRTGPDPSPGRHARHLAGHSFHQAVDALDLDVLLIVASAIGLGVAVDSSGLAAVTGRGTPPWPVPITLHVDAAVARRAAALQVPDAAPIRDALIGATVLVYEMTVVTRNVKGFARFDGLDIIDPWNP